MLLKACCRGRGSCARMDVRAALAHAAMRSRRTGRNQNVRYVDGTWRITEAPRRRRNTKEKTNAHS